MIRRIGALCILASLSVSAANGQEPISGAFGIVLGEYFDRQNGSCSDGTSARENLPVCNFMPSNPVSFLQQYEVYLTPTSHRVFEITATGQLPDDETCVAQFAFLSEALSKYGGIRGSERIGRYIMYSEVTQGMQTIRFSCFSVTYNSANLQRLAYQELEEIQLERNRALSEANDASGL